MKIKVLGSGGAFSTKYGNTQLFLDSGNPETSLLFDCGETALSNFSKCGFDTKNIHNLFISHAHSDHIGGLSTLALMKYFIPGHTKPVLYCRKEIANRIWNEYLAITLETLSDSQLPKGKEKAQINDFFIMKKLGGNDVFVLGMWHIKPIQTVHVVSGGDIWDSFGLKIIDENGKNILITGDTQFCPHQLLEFYKNADVIINDCETGGFLEKPFKSGVHAHIADLVTLPNEIKKKMYLIHYGDNITIDIATEICKNHGFAGFLFQNDEITL